jgi:hypothetical protein
MVEIEHKFKTMIKAMNISGDIECFELFPDFLVTNAYCIAVRKDRRLLLHFCPRSNSTASWRGKARMKLY